MEDWQPIETAPKDGTRIDLWVADFTISANGLSAPENGQRITNAY